MSHFTRFLIDMAAVTTLLSLLGWYLQTPALSAEGMTFLSVYFGLGRVIRVLEERPA